MLKKINFLNSDPELYSLIKKENTRQEENIVLVASENYASSLILKLQGSKLTNKYAEGYPGNRYYAGCKYVDMIEQLAINRAKKLFDAEYANVQPHSGSQANFAVYLSLLKLGDTILGMDLSHGGHLTHGASINFSGKLYNVVNYKTNKYGEIDYYHLHDLAKLHNPKMIVGGTSSYSRIINWKKMREIADKFNAYLFIDMSHISGLVAAKMYPNPIEYAHVVSTTTHKTLAGPRGGIILAKNGTEELYNKINAAVFPGVQGGPLMHIIAAKAAAFKEAMLPKFRKYQKQVLDNAKFMVQYFLSRGFNIISNDTESHLFVIDLRNKNITGKEASASLNKANIIVNKNLIPDDPNGPNLTSGIRIGTPAITRRGLKKFEISKICFWICKILENIEDEIYISNIKRKVVRLCKKYPVYF